MYIIPWETCSTETKKKVIADIGDIRLILNSAPDYWTLSMGIRVYTHDKKRSMVRPPVTVLHIPMPCELEDAKHLTEDYLNQYLSSILGALIMK